MTTRSISAKPTMMGGPGDPCLLNNGINVKTKAPEIVQISVSTPAKLDAPTRVDFRMPVVAPGYYKGNVEPTVTPLLCLQHED